MDPTVYLLLAIIIFSINVVPAFMPPTWLVLAYVYITYHLFFIPTVIIGALFATLGRIMLYYFAKNYFYVFFPKKSRENLIAAGEYFNKRKHITIPLLVAYAFFPVPSNQIYIAAGLARLNIQIMVAAFFIGRLISYTFWVGAAKIGNDSLNGLFLSHISRADTLLINLGGFALLYLISRIRWYRLPSKGRK